MIRFIRIFVIEGSCSTESRELRQAIVTENQVIPRCVVRILPPGTVPADLAKSGSLSVDHIPLKRFGRVRAFILDFEILHHATNLPLQAMATQPESQLVPHRSLDPTS